MVWIGGSFHLAALVSILAIVMASVLPPGSSYYIPDSGDDVVKRAMDLVRDKRYTDTQERASSFCTGLCMYEERKAYGDCFDLCNWNGRGQSPWAQVDKGRKDSENSVDALASMYRTGGNKGKGADRGGKARGGRSGAKASSSWDANY